MKSSSQTTFAPRNANRLVAPSLAVKKLGLVSRDYNKDRDCSAAYGEILQRLDREGCDTVLFSLFTIIPRKSFDPTPIALKKVNCVLFEEFKEAYTPDGKIKREGLGFTVLHRNHSKWSLYRLLQQFGTITGKSQEEVLKFVQNEMPRRVLGNACILLCGETNGVKYSKSSKSVEDSFGLRRSIPRDVNIILNPIHDRMSRFEMTLKRRFLSLGNRWIVSVWNKGRKDKNGNTRDGEDRAWTVFRNGRSVNDAVMPIAGPSGFEIGVLQIL